MPKFYPGLYHEEGHGLQAYKVGTNINKPRKNVRKPEGESTIRSIKNKKTSIPCNLCGLIAIRTVPCKEYKKPTVAKLSGLSIKEVTNAMVKEFNQEQIDNCTLERKIPTE